MFGKTLVFSDPFARGLKVGLLRLEWIQGKLIWSIVGGRTNIACPWGTTIWICCWSNPDTCDTPRLCDLLSSEANQEEGSPLALSGGIRRLLDMGLGNWLRLSVWRGMLHLLWKSWFKLSRVLDQCIAGRLEMIPALVMVLSYGVLNQTVYHFLNHIC